jgi:hypothetical protein
LPEPAPALSYIVRADEWTLVAEVAESLARQDSSDAIELLVVSRREIEVPPAAPVPAVRVIVDPAPDSWAASLARGVSESEAELVALGETHVLLSPTWASGALALHRDGADVVLPLMVNGNAGSALSEAAFAMDYGRWIGGGRAPSGVPLYNATFRRSLLAGGSLAETLSPGPALEQFVRSRGAAVVSEAEPAGAVAHLNVDRPFPWIDERFSGGFVMATHRCRGWSPWRRLVFAAAFPAIAVTLTVRGRRSLHPGVARGAFAALAVGSLLYAAGEACGYLRLSAASAEKRMERYEMYKRLYVGSPR